MDRFLLRSALCRDLTERPPGRSSLCEEHADLKDEATYEDAKGIRRKRMHAAQPQLCRFHFRVVRRKTGNRGLSRSIRQPGTPHKAPRAGPASPSLRTDKSHGLADDSDRHGSLNFPRTGQTAPASALKPAGGKCRVKRPCTSARMVYRHRGGHLGFVF